MSTLEVKPKKGTNLNTKLLPISAILLLVLALLFMATPLLPISSFSGGNGINRQFNDQNLPGGQNGLSGQGFPNQPGGLQGQGFPNQPGGLQDQGNTTTPNRQFTNQTPSLLRLGFLNGITGTIVYALLLLAALVAAVGMFLVKRWGQVLGIILAVVYLLLGLVSFLPMILLGFARALNGLSLGLSILRLVLAIAVIVLAMIPAKKVLAPIMPATPATPPVVHP
jgi:hypothetical protein